MSTEIDKTSSADCAFWATIANKVHLQKGDYTFIGREYLREIMQSRARQMVMMKGTQGGASITILLMALWGMIYKHFSRGVLYLFPTATDVREYSQAVLNPLLLANRGALGRYVKSQSSSTNTTTLKQVNGANLFMRGAMMPQKVDSQVAETSQMKGISADILIADEVELFDQEVLAKARGRFGASVDIVDGVVDYDTAVAREVFIGNPGIPEYGIDKFFNQSDQRHWFRKCGCGEWTCAELSFPECVKIRPNGRGYIGCMKCGDEVFVRDGEWVAKDRTKEMSGYRWSQLTSPCPKDPGMILKDFLDPPENNLADVYRISLGLPYVNTEERLTSGQVYDCCGDSIMGMTDPGPCAFGLDVGKICHLVIGKRLGRHRYEIVKMARLPGDGDWDEIMTMIRKFNCKSGVVDSRPYESAARRLQKAMKMKIYLCEYSESSVIGKTFNEKTGIVKVNRTEIFDASHALVSEKGVLTLPKRHTPEIAVFANQVCNPAKSLEVNKRTRQSVYRYIGSEDHYRNALNYFLLAVDKIGVASQKTSGGYDWSYHPQEQNKVMNEYARL